MGTGQFADKLTVSVCRVADWSTSKVFDEKFGMKITINVISVC